METSRMRPLGEEDGEWPALPNAVVNSSWAIVISVRVFLHAPHLRPCTSRVIRRPARGGAGTFHEPEFANNEVARARTTLKFNGVA